MRLATDGRSSRSLAVFSELCAGRRCKQPFPTMSVRTDRQAGLSVSELRPERSTCSCIFSMGMEE